MNSSLPLPSSGGAPGGCSPHGPWKSTSTPDSRWTSPWISAPLSGSTTTRSASLSSTTLRQPVSSPKETLAIGGNRLEDVPVRGQAAVDGEVDAGDSGRVVRGEEGARGRDLIGADEPAQRDAVEPCCQVVHRPGRNADLGHLRVREAGADAVDAHAVRAELERHRPAQPQ